MREKLIIATLAFCIPVLAYATSAYESDTKVALDVIGTAGTGATYEISPSKIFRSDKDMGQNLYNLIYNKVRSVGSDLAISRTLARRSLSKEELFLLLPGSNLGEALAKSSSQQDLTPEEVAAKQADIVREVAEEKELADLEVQAKMDTAPTELFANGDESDSGFDLLVDLQVIEKILFGKTETQFGTAGPGAPAGTNVIGLGRASVGSGQSQPESSVTEPSAAVGSEAGDGSGASSVTGSGTAGVPPSGAGVKTDQTGKLSKPTQHEAEAGNICPLNQSFHAAVLRAKQMEQENVGAKNIADSSGDSYGSAAFALRSPGALGGTGAPDKPTSGAAGGQEQSGTGIKTKIVPEPPGDWSRPLPCTSTFCLTFEAVYKKESSYQATDNCIACHFEKINDAFKKTVDHNLVPSKATGNTGEGPKCKRALLGLKWNLVLIPQPILTPPNDDLVVKGDFIKNLTDFFDKYYNNPGRCKGGEAGGACKPDDAFTKIPDEVTNQIPPGTDQTEALRRINQQIAAKKAEQAQLIPQMRLEHEAVTHAEQFQVLLQEIDTMNSYFEGFVRIFNQINAEPCERLFNLEQCS